MSEIKVNKAFLDGLKVALMGNLNFIYYGTEKQLEQCSQFLNLYLKDLNILANIYNIKSYDTQIKLNDKTADADIIIINDVSKSDYNLVTTITNYVIEKGYYKVKNGKAIKDERDFMLITGQSKKDFTEETFNSIHHIKIDLTKYDREIILDEYDTSYFTDHTVFNFFLNYKLTQMDEYTKLAKYFDSTDLNKFFETHLQNRKDNVLLSIIDMATKHHLDNNECLQLKQIIVVLSIFHVFGTKETIEKVIERYMDK